MLHANEYIEGWEEIHSQSSNPFDQDKPYEWIVNLEEQGAIKGKVLDAGCGAGHNAIYLADAGHPVVGVDISKQAVSRATQKADDQGVSHLHFLRRNICNLSGFDQEFDTIIDIGCFHSLNGMDRLQYAKALRRACMPGAVAYIRAFSESNMKRKAYSGPHCSIDDIYSAFKLGWHIDAIDEQEITLEELLPEKQISVDAWFMKIVAEPVV